MTPMLLGLALGWTLVSVPLALIVGRCIAARDIAARVPTQRVPVPAASLRSVPILASPRVRIGGDAASPDEAPEEQFPALPGRPRRG